MKFTSLADAERAYNDLVAQNEVLLATEGAMLVVMQALVMKHHDYDQLQLCITSILEMVDAKRHWPVRLNDRQRAVAREFVEHLQRWREFRADLKPFTPPPR